MRLPWWAACNAAPWCWRLDKRLGRQGACPLFLHSCCAACWPPRGLPWRGDGAALVEWLQSPFMACPGVEMVAALVERLQSPHQPPRGIRLQVSLGGSCAGLACTQAPAHKRRVCGSQTLCSLQYTQIHSHVHTSHILICRHLCTQSPLLTHTHTQAGHPDIALAICKADIAQERLRAKEKRRLGMGHMAGLPDFRMQLRWEGMFVVVCGAHAFSLRRWR